MTSPNMTPPKGVKIWSLIDGVSVSIASSQNALPANVNSDAPTMPNPFERAALYISEPRYGWPNWFVANASSSHTQSLCRLVLTESHEIRAYGLPIENATSQNS